MISSVIDVYAYLYKDHFDPFNPSENLLLKHYGHCGVDQFKVVTFLHSSEVYELVITTAASNVTGVSEVLVTGEHAAIFEPIRKYDHFL